MNLFVTDPCPEKSAMALDDKRVGKLLMEANQMLSLAVKLRLPEHLWEDHVGEGMLSAGLAHKNHPVSIWVRETNGNFEWTCCHAAALGAEWEFRFGRRHGSAARTDFIMANFKHCIGNDLRTPFQNSAKNLGLGVDFSHLPVPESYRAYLRCRWPGDARAPEWTNRGAPSWR